MNVLLTKVASFFRLKRRRRILFLQVVLLSAYRGMLVTFRSPLASSERLYQQDSLSADLPASEEQMELIADISAAIRMGARYIPWLNVCRHQAWQAIRLLRKHRIPYTYHVGLKKNSSNGKREAHAWVLAGGRFVSGHCRIEDYFEIKF
ncbi:MAG: lasso peptide biosynthesis B2 protein [Lunatimonas sp.]|uniref:lasso peptide biosynthesis B2 protein n=1 Tax=Lunatimonas sp. TaxID=2060141 RepID=UPI00263B09FC|nr:lasso peptide biosynthesis B2 protein [Lunatimonas sp.]MCC5937000.1 lasso peptide biosynthesis B2 protein [Lunatimonas sp.]